MPRLGACTELRLKPAAISTLQRRFWIKNYKKNPMDTVVSEKFLTGTMVLENILQIKISEPSHAFGALCWRFFV